jgi:orotate phosphoribosyltransferase
LEPGERVLVVEDVITQGGRAREALDIVREHGGEVAGVGVVIDRSNGVFDPGVPLERLVAVDVETYDAANLPSDLAAIEAVKPGS